MTSDSELRCRLAARCYDNTRKYKPLADWLGVYEYILPDERKLLQVERVIFDSTDAFLLWEFCYLLECCLTLNEQGMIWQLINEYLT